MGEESGESGRSGSAIAAGMGEEGGESGSAQLSASLSESGKAGSTSTRALFASEAKSASGERFILGDDMGINWVIRRNSSETRQGEIKVKPIDLLNR